MTAMNNPLMLCSWFLYTAINGIYWAPAKWEAKFKNLKQVFVQSKLKKRSNIQRHQYYPLNQYVSVRHCGNEPLAHSLPSEPSVALEAGIPVNTSQISFLFFSFCVSVASLQTSAGCWRGLIATSPLPPLFSCSLSSLPFSCSSVWAPLSWLLFCLIELFGRQACQTAPSMWGVRGAGGYPPLCSQRRVSFSMLLLHEWTWPRLGPGGAGTKFMKFCEGLWRLQLFW